MREMDVTTTNAAKFTTSAMDEASVPVMAQRSNAAPIDSPEFTLFPKLQPSEGAAKTDKLPGRNRFADTVPQQNLKQLVPQLDPWGIDLLERMLAFDPARRISALEAMKHAYFAN